MPVSSRMRQTGNGALSMVGKRNNNAQLMRQGISNATACRTLNIDRRTGMRWRHGRTVTNTQGRATTYAPIQRKSPPTISSRDLSEDERIQIADALRDALSKHLLEQWSPRQIRHQLRIDFPEQPKVRVAHETIYQDLYSPSTTGLSRGMTRHLRTAPRAPDTPSHHKTAVHRARPLPDRPPRPAQPGTRVEHHEQQGSPLKHAPTPGSPAKV